MVNISSLTYYSINRFNTERHLFAKLASQCAQLSTSESILFDNDPYAGPASDAHAVDDVIVFAPLTDEQHEAIRKEMISSLKLDYLPH
jgi:hypothetical protein